MPPLTLVHAPHVKRLGPHVPQPLTEGRVQPDHQELLLGCHTDYPILMVSNVPFGDSVGGDDTGQSVECRMYIPVVRGHCRNRTDVERTSAIPGQPGAAGTTCTTERGAIT